MKLGVRRAVGCFALLSSTSSRHSSSSSSSTTADAFALNSKPARGTGRGAATTTAPRRPWRNSKVSPMDAPTTPTSRRPTRLSATTAVPDARGPAWHRRVLGGVFRRRSKQTAASSASSSPSTSSSLKSTSGRSTSPSRGAGLLARIKPERSRKSITLSQTPMMLDLEGFSSSAPATVSTVKPFIQESFEVNSPASVFDMDSISTLSSPSAVSALQPFSSSSMPNIDFGLREEEEDAADSMIPTGLVQQRVSRLNRMTCSRIETVLERLFSRWARGDHDEMDVYCALAPGGLRTLLSQGLLQCYASVDMGRINFNALRLSGGRLEAHGLALNLWSFAPSLRPQKQREDQPQVQRRRPPRFPNQFDFVAHNATLTQQDLMGSPCIRHGLRRLLTRILHARGFNTMFIRIDDMVVLPSNKLSVQGTATTILGQHVPFEVRTGLGMHSRGHVLTFPGLEISLSGFFVPVVPEITIDLGHNAQLLDVKLNGAEQTLQLSARVTITPEHTLQVTDKYHQSTRSYAARCAVDVGRWLTRLGHFST